MFGSLAGGAVACARYVEKVTGYPATRLTAHSKGLDLPAWDPRGLRGNGMAYMTANVGASHMRAGYKIPTGLPNSSAVDLMPELISSQNSIVIRDSMILCAFAKGATPDSVMTQAWNSITGDDAEWSDLLEKAAKQWDQARRWNCEHWARLDKNPRDQDKLSWRFARALAYRNCRWNGFICRRRGRGELSIGTTDFVDGMNKEFHLDFNQ